MPSCKPAETTVVLHQLGDVNVLRHEPVIGLFAHLNQQFWQTFLPFWIERPCAKRRGEKSGSSFSESF